MENAEIMECAKAIKEYCNKRHGKCEGCLFAKTYDSKENIVLCRLKLITPLWWDLSEEGMKEEDI